MTDTSRLSRKDLKGPDEFISTFSQAFAWVRQNQNRVLGAVAALLLLVGAVAGTRSYFSWSETKAANELWPHLNRAQEILQAPENATAENLVSIEQPLSAFVQRHPKAKAAVYAHYYLGSVAFTRGNHDIAISQFKSALEIGRDLGIMRFLPQLGLAQALEAKGDFASASVAYKEAASSAPGGLKFQARLGEARTLSLLGRGAEAVAIYRDILAGNPDPSTKEFAEIKLALLQ